MQRAHTNLCWKTALDEPPAVPENPSTCSQTRTPPCTPININFHLAWQRWLPLNWNDLRCFTRLPVSDTLCKIRWSDCELNIAPISMELALRRAAQTKATVPRTEGQKSSNSSWFLVFQMHQIAVIMTVFHKDRSWGPKDLCLTCVYKAWKPCDKSIEVPKAAHTFCQTSAANYNLWISDRVTQVIANKEDKQKALSCLTIKDNM